MATHKCPFDKHSSLKSGSIEHKVRAGPSVLSKQIFDNTFYRHEKLKKLRHFRRLVSENPPYKTGKTETSRPISSKSIRS